MREESEVKRVAEAQRNGKSKHLMVVGGGDESIWSIGWRVCLRPVWETFES